MSCIKVGKSLDLDMVLWRYMSIDKLINLLDTQQLFLAPLSFYQETDPFEGLRPKVAFNAELDISEKQTKKLHDAFIQIQNTIAEAARHPKIALFPDNSTKLDEFVTPLEELRSELSRNHNKISKSTGVHCWYHSKTESEAMWKLYSDSGKGIAVKTRVSSLVESINSRKQTLQLRIGKIKYLLIITDLGEPDSRKLSIQWSNPRASTTY